MTSTGDPGIDETQTGSVGRLDPYLLDDLWDFDHPAISERRFRELINRTPVGRCAHAELTTQLARAVGLQGRYDEATELLDAVEVLDCDLPVVRIRLRLERGRVLNSSGAVDRAVANFREALESAQASGEEFLEVDAAHMLAIADRERADGWTELALRVVVKARDPRTQRWAGALHNNAGWSRLDVGDYAAALDEFEAALAAYSLHGTVEQVRVARWAVGRALRSLARFAEALDIQQRLAALGPADGYVQEELTELLLATGQGERARGHAAAAVELLAADRWFVQCESGRLERLRQIASTPSQAQSGAQPGQ
jgi:tetratricopeptide (TPR) repeat protein